LAKLNAFSLHRTRKLIFETHELRPPLDKFIEKIFYYKDFIPEHHCERVVPTGSIFLVFELEGKTSYLFDNTSLKRTRPYTEAWVSGMHKHYFSVSSHRHSEMLLIQFKSFGGYPFLHTPIDKLNNKNVPADDFFGKEILKLREQLIEKRTFSEKFALIESWLNQRFDINKIPDAELISVVSQFMTSPVTHHKKIICSYSKTQKNLISEFKKFCGLTPKTLHRVYRFNEVLEQIKNKELINWAQIAYHLGYSDQSHFIKEFKEFSGFNPKEFISLDYNKEEPNFFPLHE
jgi:AraC-like DNA-binding protein